MKKSAEAVSLIEQGLALLGAGLAKIEAAEEWVDQNHSPIGKRAHLEAAREGKLIGRKVGHLVLVKRVELDAYIEKHRITPKVAPDESGDLEREIEALVRRKRA